MLVATSNRKPPELYENGINRNLFVPFIKDLEANCDVVSMGDSPDYRMRVSPGRVLSYYSDPVEFDKALVSLETNEFHKVKLAISKTQSITLGQSTDLTSRKIRKTSFENLCVQNRGPLDFKACTKCEILVITDVKQFKYYDFDAAKRLITLVDIAYDQQCKLILKSDCPLGS